MLRALVSAVRRLIYGPAAGAKAESDQPARAEMPIASGTPLTVAVRGRSEGRDLMNAAYEQLIKHLDEQNIGYWSHREDQAVCADFRGAVGNYRVFARVDADDDLFQVFGQSPVRVPAGCRSAIAETVARINCGLKIGKFEMNFDEGDLRFQASQILPEDQLEDGTIQRLFGVTIAMLDTYLPAVLSVIYGNELPADAVRQAEPRRSESGAGDSGAGDAPTDE
jgi:hypothetical protein